MPITQIARRTRRVLDVPKLMVVLTGVVILRTSFSGDTMLFHSCEMGCRTLAIATCREGRSFSGPAG